MQHHKIIGNPPDYGYNFNTISEFKWCMIQGGEIQFIWNGRSYSVLPSADGKKIEIGEGYFYEDGVYYNVGNGEPCIGVDGSYYDTLDNILEHEIDGEKLRKIITKAKVWFRTI